MSVYKDALANDPQIREADALRKASREVKPQAWAALLPQITAQGQWTKGKTENTQPSLQANLGTGETVLVPRTTNSKPDSRQWSFDLRQNLFSYTNWASLAAADASVAQAEADYRTAQQALMQRASQRYFAVLAAQDTLEAQQGRSGSLQPPARPVEQAL